MGSFYLTSSASDILSIKQNPAALLKSGVFSEYITRQPLSLGFHIMVWLKRYQKISFKVKGFGEKPPGRPKWWNWIYGVIKKMFQYLAFFSKTIIAAMAYGEFKGTFVQKMILVKTTFH